MEGTTTKNLYFFIYSADIIDSAVSAEHEQHRSPHLRHQSNGTLCWRNARTYVPRMSKIVNWETATKRFERPYAVLMALTQAFAIRSPADQPNTTLAQKQWKLHEQCKHMPVATNIITHTVELNFVPRSGWTQRWSSCGAGDGNVAVKKSENVVVVGEKIGWQRTNSSPVARFIICEKSFGDFISLLTCPSEQFVCHNHLTEYSIRSAKWTNEFHYNFFFVLHDNFECRMWSELKTKKLLRSLIWRGRYEITNSLDKFAVWVIGMRGTYQNMGITALALARTDFGGAQAFFGRLWTDWAVPFTSNRLSKERLHSFLVSRMRDRLDNNLCQ